MEKILQRVILSNAFRRMKGKTQLITDLVNDNCRVRLSHTTEVVSISEDIAKRVNKDVNLAKIIAYSHDIGHTPFGHIGERTLHKISCGKNDHFYKLNKIIEEFPKYKGFKHNLQGVRLLVDLEKIIPRNYPKWNLVLYGVANHTKYYYSEDDILEGSLGIDKNLQYYMRYQDELSKSSYSEEAIIVFVADEISQIIGNIEDGISLGIITFSEVYSIIDNNFVLLRENSGDFKIKELSNNLEKIIFGDSSREYNKDVLRELSTFLWELLVAIAVDAFKKGSREKLFENIKVFLNELDDFFLNRIIKSHLIRTLDLEAENRIVEVFNFYFTYPERLPEDTKSRFVENVKSNINPTFNDFNTIKKNIEKYLTTKDDEIIEQLSKVCTSEVFNADTELKTIKLLVLELMRTIIDHISGMTDNYVIKVLNSLKGVT